MKVFLLASVVLLSGCAAKFDPKVDPDIALIVSAINEDRGNFRRLVDAVNLLAYQSEKHRPGELKKLEVEFLKERAKNEGKS